MFSHTGYLKRSVGCVTAAVLAAWTAAAPITAGTAPLSVLTAYAEDAPQEPRFESFEFQFLSEEASGKSVNYTDTFYYSDSYFSGDSFSYDPSLASASLALAMSSFPKAGTAYSAQSRNARTFMNNIGISDDMISVNKDFREEPMQDTIGVIVGSKKIPSGTEGEDIDLIVVGIRGSGYTHEWSGNFNAGTEGDHNGFWLCSEEVLRTIREHISEHGITGRVKLWIAGYSRGAAAADLTAGKLDDGASLGDEVTLDKSDLYAYCFETPSGTLSENSSDPFLSGSYSDNRAAYGNIFNIINPSDPVIYVPPASLGFGRYGNEIYLPTRSNTEPAAYRKALDTMLSLYPAEKAGAYTIDSFKEKRISLLNGEDGIMYDLKYGRTQDKFLSDFFDEVSKNLLVSREYYTANNQDTVRKTIDLFLSSPSSKMQSCLDTFADEFKSYILENIAGSAKILPLLSIYNTNPDLVVPYLINALRKNKPFDAGSTLKQSMDKAGLSYAGMLDDEDFAVISQLFDKLLSYDPLAAITLLSNTDSIKQGHYPVVCWSWVRSMDPNYTADPTPVPLTNGDYYQLAVNNSADVKVYSKDGTLSASIVKEQPQSVSGGITAYIDQNMQKTVIIPKGCGYTASVSPTDDSTVNIQLLEYNGGTNGFIKNTNYFGVPIKTTGALSVSFNEQGETKGADAIVRTAEGTALSPDKILEGAEEAGGGKDLTLKAYNNGGVLVGGGNYQYGSFVSIAAVASDNYRFEGWYNGNEKVTTDKYGRVCVTDDMTLTADFARRLTRASRITAEVTAPAKTDLGKAKMTILNSAGRQVYTGAPKDGTFYAEITDSGSSFTARFELPGYAPREVKFEVKNNRFDIGKLMLCAYGDVNSDGRVDLFDLGTLQRKLCGWDIAFEYEAIADVDLSGKVDLRDLGIMQRYLAGWDVTLGGAV